MDQFNTTVSWRFDKVRCEYFVINECFTLRNIINARVVVTYCLSLLLWPRINGQKTEVSLTPMMSFSMLNSRKCISVKKKERQGLHKSPKYLFSIIPTSVSTYNTRNTNIPLFKVKHNFFRNSFFSSTVIKWNKLDPNICNLESLNIFKKTLLNFIRPSGSTVFNCHNPKGVKLLTRSRLGLSHLREHKFKHSFQDSLNPICSCGNDIETSAHFLLHCPNFSNERSTFMNIIRSIDRNILTWSDSQVTKTLLYGNSNSNNITNLLILNTTIYFLLATKRFDGSLL